MVSLISLGSAPEIRDRSVGSKAGKSVMLRYLRENAGIPAGKRSYYIWFNLNVSKYLAMQDTMLSD
jgi:hypothetical protein